MRCVWLNGNRPCWCGWFCSIWWVQNHFSPFLFLSFHFLSTLFSRCNYFVPLFNPSLCFSFGLWLYYPPLSCLALPLFNSFVLLHLCSYALVRFELAASGEWELWSVWKRGRRKRHNSQHLCTLYRQWWVQLNLNGFLFVQTGRLINVFIWTI